MTNEITHSSVVRRHGLTNHEGDKPTACQFITSQIGRIAASTFQYAKDLEMGMEKIPKNLRWTDLNMTKCGWKLLTQECIQPCIKDSHDHILIATHEAGITGVLKPKTCVLSFSPTNDNEQLEKDKNGVW